MGLQQPPAICIPPQQLTATTRHGLPSAAQAAATYLMQNAEPRQCSQKHAAAEE
jgi:hypothetical protein